MSSYRNEGSENKMNDFKFIVKRAEAKGNNDVVFPLSQNSKIGQIASGDRSSALGSF